MLKSSKLLTSSQFKAPIAEAYKTLRTNIQFSSLDNPIRVILVTSSGPSEGKSTTAANLAISMAQSDKRVLLLDCDFRKPSLHRAFNIVNAKGLTNVLVEDLHYLEITNDVGIQNLQLLTSGPKPPNPSELLGSAKMKHFVDTLKESYDIVILDTPPLLPVTDAAVLSQVVDGCILVVTYGLTSYEMAHRAKESLQKVGAKILGTVINNIPTRGHGYSYYYYYYDNENAPGKRRRRKPLLQDK
jgi:capsular exopolysaccharide synthesis family protein